MKTRTANIRCGRTIPHPMRCYANIKTEVELGVEFEDTDDVLEKIDELRVMAEQLVHTHQSQVSESIRRGEEIETTASRITQLEAQLEELRKKQQGHQQLLFANSEVNIHEDDD